MLWSRAFASWWKICIHLRFFAIARFLLVDNPHDSPANDPAKSPNLVMISVRWNDTDWSRRVGPRGLVMVSYQVGNYSIPRGFAVFLVPDSTNARSRATNKRRIIVNDDPWYCTPMMKGRVSGFQARVHICRYGNGSRLLASLLDPIGDLKYHLILKSVAQNYNNATSPFIRTTFFV